MSTVRASSIMRVLNGKRTTIKHTFKHVKNIINRTQNMQYELFILLVLYIFAVVLCLNFTFIICAIKNVTIKML